MQYLTNNKCDSNNHRPFTKSHSSASQNFYYHLFQITNCAFHGWSQNASALMLLKTESMYSYSRPSSGSGFSEINSRPYHTVKQKKHWQPVAYIASYDFLKWSKSCLLGWYSLYHSLLHLCTSSYILLCMANMPTQPLLSYSNPISCWNNRRQRWRKCEFPSQRSTVWPICGVCGPSRVMPITTEIAFSHTQYGHCHRACTMGCTMSCTQLTIITNNTLFEHDW